MAQKKDSDKRSQMISAVTEKAVKSFSKWLDIPAGKDGNNYSMMRFGVFRFFNDPNWMDVVLDVISEMELMGIKDPGKCEYFINELRKIAIIEHSQKIIATHDSLTIMIADLGGESRDPGLKQEEAFSWDPRKG